jgi:hypothetical protein
MTCALRTKESSKISLYAFISRPICVEDSPNDIPSATREAVIEATDIVSCISNLNDVLTSSICAWFLKSVLLRGQKHPSGRG